MKIAVIIFSVASLIISGCSKTEETEETYTEAPEFTFSEQNPVIDIYAPVRPFPKKFPKRTKMPGVREVEASGEIVPSSFSAARDLVYVDDERVWWESDHDGETDDECDHSMHISMELPFRRLVELCAASNATLRVQEAYRATGIHAGKSLHKEGRALDITCPSLDPDNKDPKISTALSLELLSKLAWAAGFDWVYNEWPKNGGPHVHASVRAVTEQQGKIEPEKRGVKWK